MTKIIDIMLKKRSCWMLEGTNRAIVGLNFLYALDASRGDLVYFINNVKQINDLL